MNSLSAVPSVSMTSPPAQFNTKGSLVLEGSCAAAPEVEISGGIAAAVKSACSAGRFSAALVLNGGDGPKTIYVQPAGVSNSAVSRVFVKDTVAPILNLITPVSGAQV